MTWRVHFYDRELYQRARESGAVVLAFWHGDQLSLIPLHRSSEIAGMASWSHDGALLAAILGRFGYRVVRGGSSRGGDAAYRESVHALKSGVSPALAVDGPRGPRHSVKYGAARLSIESGRPIVFVVAHANMYSALSSWDRFVIPWPGSKVHVAYGCLWPKGKQSTEELTELLREQMLGLSSRLRSFSGPLVD